jgi:uncharacterized iron-regulated protein
MKRLRESSVVTAMLLATACTPSWVGIAPATSATAPMSSPALRVVQSATGAAVSFDDLISQAAMSDIVFFGEQHDDPETHFAEFALLEGIGRHRDRVVLSLEMFERDVQPMLDDYLAGRMSEADFLEKSRPWPRYATDYRPLVMLAKARGWPVVAANVPRPIAAAVNHAGLAALDMLTPASRAWAAAQISCPHDAYYARVAAEASGHSPGNTTMTPADSAQMAAMTDRFYEAQCIKDETMGESIAHALRGAGEDAIVVHFNGAFHTDYRQGTAARVLRRVPGARVLVITAVPAADPARASLGDATSRADYVVVTKGSGATQR